MKKIQTYNETSLHASIKDWYAKPGDIIESQVDGYRIDIVRGDQLIEIQVKNFSRLKEKLAVLLANYKVRIIYPIPRIRWIHYADTQKRRLSPRKGKLEHIFQELVYITSELTNSNLSLELLFVHEEEIRQNDGLGSWRRRGISIVDRKLLDIVDRVPFYFPASFQQMLETLHNQQFTTREIAKHRDISENLARKMVYCLWKTDLIAKIGKRGHHNLYSLNFSNLVD
ncbi:MAG: hypothetical protein JSV61_08930 [Anaerolineales bacterium]|nr:MAG: hypothetical protein JSV61_08930 [Anaerolineales bacterium]